MYVHIYISAFVDDRHIHSLQASFIVVTKQEIPGLCNQFYKLAVKTKQKTCFHLSPGRKFRGLTSLKSRPAEFVQICTFCSGEAKPWYDCYFFIHFISTDTSNQQTFKNRPVEKTNTLWKTLTSVEHIKCVTLFVCLAPKTVSICFG